MQVKRKIMWGGLTSLAVLSIPVVSVISCGANNKENKMKNSESYNNLVMLRDWKLSNIAGTEDQKIFGDKLVKTLQSYNKNVIKSKTISSRNGGTIAKGYDSAPKPGSSPQVYFHEFNVDKSLPIKLADGRIQSDKGRNVILDIPAKNKSKNSDKVIMIGAHYDIMARHAGYKDTEAYYDAANDNRSGDADVLALANYFINNPQNFAIRIAFWDWEEEGTVGSLKYVEDIMKHKVTQQTKNLYGGPVKFYLNLDSPAGGQFTYMGHGFDDKQAPFDSKGRNGEEDFFKVFWDKNTAMNLGIMPEYPEGTQGIHKFKMGDMPADISDESPFNQIGIPIVGMESTNYSLVSKSGTKDGYAQSDGKVFWFPKTHIDEYSMWDLYNVYKQNKTKIKFAPNIEKDFLAAEKHYEKSSKTRPDRRAFSAILKKYKMELIKQFDRNHIQLFATKKQIEIGVVGGPYNTPGVNEGGYPRYMEEGNGYIWHTKMDTITNLNKVYPGKLDKQLNSIYKVIANSISLKTFEDTLK
ncbi:MAG: M28 family peptidase [Mycoplasmatales bacterium]|nr:M28 family peptidase [Mycoplasmatales bacterium]